MHCENIIYTFKGLVKLGKQDDSPGKPLAFKLGDMRSMSWSPQVVLYPYSLHDRHIYEYVCVDAHTKAQDKIITNTYILKKATSHKKSWVIETISVEDEYMR